MKEQVIISLNKTNSLILESAKDSKFNESLGEVPDGCMRLSGVFGVTGVMNNNNRFYSYDNYKSVVESLQARMQNEAVFGEVEHPKTMQLTWDNVSHKLESINISESGVVTGTILLLDTDKGKLMQKLVKRGLKLKISSRGKGVVTESKEVKLSVLETFDLVYKPGFSQAVVDVMESEVEGETYIIETACYSLDGEEKQVTESIDVEALKESLKAELKAELVTESSQNLDLDIVEKFFNENLTKIIEKSELKMQNLLHESMVKFGRATQNWVIKEFAPNQLNYLNEHFRPQIMEEVMEAQNESAMAYQKWTVNEFAPAIQGWFLESLNDDFKALLESKNETEEEEEENANEDTKNGDKAKEEVDTNDGGDKSKEDDKPNDGKQVDESINENQEEQINEGGEQKSLSERIEEQLESMTRAKEKERLVNEAVEVEKQKQITEAEEKKQTLLEAMPNTVKHLWESSTEEFKNFVFEQAESREFVNESQMTRFWIGRFNNNNVKAIQENINESKSSEVVNNPLVQWAKSLQK
ncbi:prohead core scaffold [Tenacibaculum phage pT24]|uniref:Prohead core scaffold n=1 Tax=Tenacibaculum phage pT24 TaxID=1880590 RepID=A0A1B4XWT0_9CAUD|nr:prohead core scaffold [Tenacibaculum phage pT24]BAV39266.1 prohead core scaffold [Tenacibaculum phage pT24]